MPDLLKPTRLMEDILASYEQRIDGVQLIFDTTRAVLADYQDGPDEAPADQSLLHTQLRETLARNEHLRNKDYERMLLPIIEPRRAREKEIRRLLNEFLAEQQRLAAELKEHYARIRHQLAQGKPRKIMEELQAIKKLLHEQDQKKEQLAAHLKEAQQERQEMGALVKQLLAKGNELRIRDFKDVLKHIHQQRKERIERQLSRRAEVRQMLADFKQQRVKEMKDSPEAPAFGLRGDVRIKEALEALPWGNNRQGGEPVKDMVQEQAG